MGLKPNPLDLSSFSALTLLVGSFDPLKPVPDMTYNVFGGTLNLTLFLSLLLGDWRQRMFTCAG